MSVESQSSDSASKKVNQPLARIGAFLMVPILIGQPVLASASELRSFPHPTITREFFIGKAFDSQALSSAPLLYNHPNKHFLNIPYLTALLTIYSESGRSPLSPFATLQDIHKAIQSLQEDRAQLIPHMRQTLEVYAGDLMQELPGQQELWDSLARRVQEEARRRNESSALAPGFETSPRLILEGIHAFNLWETIAGDAHLLALLDRESAAYARRVDPRKTWVTRNLPALVHVPIAYFTAEEAWDSLGTYGGGLGVLSGDHTRGANDLGLTHVSVSLLYQQGYFRQLIMQDGRQESEDRARLDTSRPAIQPARVSGSQHDLILDLPFPNRDSPGSSKSVKAKVWLAHYGNSTKLLLDTNIPDNTPEDRLITDRLYRGSGGTHIRMEQYYLMGVGGQRALEALGWAPQVYHMNDCHPVFSALERLSDTFRDLYGAHRGDPPDRLFEAAYQLVRARTVFTTHTPIDAGNETVSLDVIGPFLRTMLNDSLASLHLVESERLAAVNYAVNRIFSMGVLDENPQELNLAALNIRMASRINGVSELHGQVSRRIWKRIFPGVEQAAVPIGDVTNAVHGEYFQAPEVAALLEEGPVRDALTPYIEHPEMLMSKLRSMSPKEALRWVDEDLLPFNGQTLWNVHLDRKKKLRDEALRRLDEQIAGGRATLQDREALASFDPEALTIGFARRFIGYKRGRLVFTDLDRLIDIAQKNKQPIQFYIAGKAHPNDEPSKRIVFDVNQKIAELRAKGVMVKAVFVENYDVRLARFLESGVDVWLNNPVRPLEASGTSGMKGAWNGVLNLSTSDGWCEEGILHQINGWLFGMINGQNDVLDSSALYNRLDHIAALYSSRDSQGVPEEWVRMMKASIAIGICQFGMQRMLSGYAKNYYLPTYQDSQQLIEQDALILAAQRLEKRKQLAEKMSAAAASAQILPYPHFISNHGELHIETEINLGSILPEDLAVDAHLRRRPSNEDDPEEHLWFGAGHHWTSLGGGRYRFTIVINSLRRGDYDVELRVTSRDQTLWASSAERMQSATHYLRGLFSIHADDEDLLKFRVRADQPAEGRLFYIHLPKDEANGEELIEDVFLVSQATHWVSADGLWKTFKLERVYDGWWAIVLPRSVTGQQGRFDFKFYTKLRDGRYIWLNGTYQHGETNAFINLEDNHAFASVANARQRLQDIAVHRPSETLRNAVGAAAYQERTAEYVIRSIFEEPENDASDLFEYVARFLTEPAMLMQVLDVIVTSTAGSKNQIRMAVEALRHLIPQAPRAIGDMIRTALHHLTQSPTVFVKRAWAFERRGNQRRAQAILEKLKQEGTLIAYWNIPSNEDHRYVYPIESDRSQGRIETPVSSEGSAFLEQVVSKINDIEEEFHIGTFRGHVDHSSPGEFAVREMITNVWKFAKKGWIALHYLYDEEGRKTGVRIICFDQGRGISNMDQALEHGFSTVGTRGLGLTKLNRELVESGNFKIETIVGEGTWLSIDIHPFRMPELSGASQKNSPTTRSA